MYLFCVKRTSAIYCGCPPKTQYIAFFVLGVSRNLNHYCAPFEPEKPPSLCEVYYWSITITTLSSDHNNNEMKQSGNKEFDGDGKFIRINSPSKPMVPKKEYYESSVILLKRLESIDDIMLSILSFFFPDKIGADNRKYKNIDAHSVRNVMLISKSWYRIAISQQLWLNADLNAQCCNKNDIVGDNDAASLDDKLIRFKNVGARYVTLNSGHNEKVFKVRKRSTGKLYSIKAPTHISNEYSLSSQTSAILREIAINCRIRGTCSNNELRYFSLPTALYFHQGKLLRHYHYTSYTLHDLFESGKSIPQYAIPHFMQKLLHAITALHARGIIHCNIIPKNIFLQGCNNLDTYNPNVQLMISDFSNACDIFDSFPKSMPYARISMRYQAPELFSFNAQFSCSRSVDIWSIGCIFAEMLNNGKSLFQGESELTKLESIIQVLGNASNLPRHPMSHPMCHPFLSPREKMVGIY